jgi:hypothetical protein
MSNTLLISVSLCSIPLITTILLNRSKLLWVSFILSTFHAILVGLYGWYGLYFEDSCLGGRPFERDYSMVDVTIGYLICDLFFVALWLSPKSIIIHHIISIIGLSMGRYIGLGYGIYLSFLRTEISTIPLNICWAMKKLKMGRGMNIYIAGMSLILSYFFFRILAIKWLVYDCVPEIYNQLPPLWSIPGSLIILANACMNILWFYQIIQKVLGNNDNEKRKTL